jgi:CHAT domain-containing protein
VSQGDDGVLTALEVTGLNLYGTDLVVLSACDTGVGEVRTGEGVFGLRRAFVLAGAKNLVMSQWLANDYYTALQMERFYQAVGRGVSPAEALQEAQLATISSLREQIQGEGGEPIAPVNLWAPFMVQQTGG